MIKCTHKTTKGNKIMFSLGHFIWLGALAAAIITAFIISKHFKPSHKRVHIIMTAVLIVLKLLHLSLSMKEAEGGGFVLNQTQLSFHLCSIQIYLVIFLNFIKNEKWIAKLKSFMVPCMLIGAAMALLIPTEGVDPSVPRVWQYMLIHGALVFYGLYLMLIEKADLSLKAYFGNLQLLLVVTAAAFVMNSVLEQYNTNFLFLRKPPMENLPVLNLDNGWYAYFLILTLIACTLVLLVQLPFIIKGLRSGRHTEDKN